MQQQSKAQAIQSDLTTGGPVHIETSCKNETLNNRHK